MWWSARRPQQLCATAPRKSRSLVFEALRAERNVILRSAGRHFGGQVFLFLRQAAAQADGLAGRHAEAFLIFLFSVRRALALRPYLLQAGKTNKKEEQKHNDQFQF